jgi:hypothetical protein
VGGIRAGTEQKDGKGNEKGSGRTLLSLPVALAASAAVGVAGASPFSIEFLAVRLALPPMSFPSSSWED